MEVPCPRDIVGQGVAFWRAGRQHVSFTIHIDSMITSLNINIEGQNFTAGQHDGASIFAGTQNTRLRSLHKYNKIRL